MRNSNWKLAAIIGLVAVVIVLAIVLVVTGHDSCLLYTSCRTALEGCEWNDEAILEAMKAIAEAEGVKNAAVMWPERIAVSGTQVTPGGAVEITRILGRDEALRRIDAAIAKLG